MQSQNDNSSDKKKIVDINKSERLMHLAREIFRLEIKQRQLENERLFYKKKFEEVVAREIFKYNLNQISKINNSTESTSANITDTDSPTNVDICELPNVIDTDNPSNNLKCSKVTINSSKSEKKRKFIRRKNKQD